MVKSFSGSFLTSVVSGIGTDWPKRANISYSGFFDEDTFRWRVVWSATATGGTRPSAWTTSYAGQVVFSKGSGSSYVVLDSKSYDTTISAYQDATLLSGDFYVTPDDDGSLQINVSGYFRFYYNSASGESTGSDTINFPDADIGSKGALSQSSINITSSNTSSTFKLAITVKGSLYHILKMGVNNTSAVIVSGVDYITDSAEVTFTYDDVLTKFPSASGNFYFYLETYKDSSHTQKYGPTNITPLAVTVSTTDFKPVVTSGYIYPDDDTNPFKTSLSNPELLVAGISDSIFKYSSLVAGRGATLRQVTYSIAYGSLSTVTGEIPLADLQTYLFGVCPASTTDYQATYTINIYDSRNALTTVTYTKDVYGYDTPKITATIYRTEGTTTTARNDSGEYVYIAFLATQAKTINGNNSVYSCTCVAEGDISGPTTSNPSPTAQNPNEQLTKNESATFYITAIDTVGRWADTQQSKDISAKLTVVVTRAIFPMVLHDDLSGDPLGKGVEINGFAEQINPANTQTMYRFESGTDEMYVGIDANGNMGVNDGTNWLLCKTAGGVTFAPVCVPITNGQITSDYKVLFVECASNSIGSLGVNTKFTFTIPNDSNVHEIGYSEFYDPWNVIYLSNFRVSISNGTLTTYDCVNQYIGDATGNAAVVAAPTILNIWGIK